MVSNSAATRNKRALREEFGTFVDAFSGEKLDLDTQMASVQYKTGARRQSLLSGSAKKDFERIGDDLWHYVPEALPAESLHFCALVPTIDGHTALAQVRRMRGR